MHSLILVRHGETDWNREDRIQGGLDIPLNGVGKKQAKSIALELTNTPINYIFSSRLSRAYDTATEITKSHQLKVFTDSRLDELRQGEWEGMRTSEARLSYLSLYSKWERNPASVTPPGGESLKEVSQRTKDFLEEKIIPQQGTGVIVAHKVINALIRLFLEKDDSMDSLWEKLPQNAQIERFIL